MLYSFLNSCDIPNPWQTCTLYSGASMIPNPTDPPPPPTLSKRASMISIIISKNRPFQNLVKINNNVFKSLRRAYPASHTMAMELRRRAIKRWVPCDDMDRKLKIPHSTKVECGFRTTTEECLYDSGLIIQYNT